ncbi:hypothetical protein P153DRAFT_389113 [Dothidotthia symphoricarpi CBS 119687]|uniref:Uncharacterized protein n=1 Tax=Dothidotthia symphoricarpi CBS 119687 TaxID=1392245 RepID=A0A6A6A4Y5_9PLEO|nr:uncharacterized protein P153DRAFT_389113 [Dothidotthia symphoricarpi CBS 119687]KAF2125661.1 hypothetical protein P153DRAFT_389113 [Dothidotthia symphoricarpi CBS 119687]
MPKRRHANTSRPGSPNKTPTSFQRPRRHTSSAESYGERHNPINLISSSSHTPLLPGPHGQTTGIVLNSEAWRSCTPMQDKSPIESHIPPLPLHRPSSYPHLHPRPVADRPRVKRTRLGHMYEVSLAAGLIAEEEEVADDNGVQPADIDEDEP